MFSGVVFVKSYVLIASLIIASGSATTQCTSNGHGSCSTLEYDSGSLLQNKVTYEAIHAGKSEKRTVAAQERAQEDESHGVLEALQKAPAPPAPRPRIKIIKYNSGGLVIGSGTIERVRYHWCSKDKVKRLANAPDAQSCSDSVKSDADCSGTFNYNVNDELCDCVKPGEICKGQEVFGGDLSGWRIYEIVKEKGGCFYQMSEKVLSKPGCTNIKWAHDAWGATRQNVKSDTNEKNCLQRKSGHDSYCGKGSSQWLWLPKPASSLDPKWHTDASPSTLAKKCSSSSDCSVWSTCRKAGSTSKEEKCCNCDYGYHCLKKGTKKRCSCRKSDEKIGY